MTIRVEFDHSWDESDLEQWIDNPDNEKFENYSYDELKELSFLAGLAYEYPYTPLSVLKEVGKSAIEDDIELRLNDIVDGISTRSLYHEVEQMMKNH